MERKETRYQRLEYRAAAWSATEQQERNERRDRLLFRQLLCSLALFSVVFVGKGALPADTVYLQQNLREYIGTTVDFRKEFSDLGLQLSKGASLAGGVEEFCVSVFGPAEETPSVPSLSPQKAVEADQSAAAKEQTIRQEPLPPSSATDVPLPPLSAQTAEPPKPIDDDVPAVPAAGTVILQADYQGKALPDRYTMDQLSLGTLETMRPVPGVVTSGYGYRNHPISGEYRFHGGTDLAGAAGDPVRAFADGTVEYIGKDDSYGLYLQLDHGNGVKSFYAHCSRLCVSQGAEVRMGDTIAEIGSTGVSTGPHLHLELKYGDLHLNPAYYLDVPPGQ